MRPKRSVRRRPSQARKPAHRGTWLVLLIAAAGIGAYANSLSALFIFDDIRNIVENPRIRQLQPIWEHLTSRRPVVSLSLTLDYALSGLDTWSYHITNLTVHLLAAFTLFGVIRRTLLREPFRDAYARAAPWLALSVAMLWVVHPLTTQSVTYVIQRGESMMGLFYLLTLYCLIRGVDSPRPRLWYIAAVVACALGMGSKAVMVTAPIVVFLYDFLLITRSAAETLRKRWGLYTCLAATWLVLVTGGVAQGVLNPDPTRHTTVGFGYKDVTPLEYAQSQPGVILHYLKLSLWPSGLCLDYLWPVARTASAIVPPAIVIGALLVVTLWSLRYRPWLGFLGAWFFLILAPTSSFIPIRDLAFEHRMYLPLAAVIVLVVVAGHRLVHLVFTRRPQHAALRRLVAGGMVCAVTVSLGVATHLRNRDYHSELGMWQDVVRVRPDNHRAHDHIGRELAAQGKLDEAIKAYREALGIRPDSFMTHFNLANALMEQGHSDEAFKHFREAIRLKPGYTEAHVNLGSALAEQKRFDEAIVEFHAALAGEPVSSHRRTQVMARACMHLGTAHFQKREYEEAIEAYRRSLSLQPGQYRAHYNMAAALQNLNRIDEAIEQYRQALRLEPSHAAARRALDALLSPGED
jgi:Tfp pilus assembly protein PilF/4-amino-4-deoxy-L-arabinose transferase-like glycosyltransferase